MRLGKPPKGFSNWSLRLLAERVVELGLTDSISHETVRKTLKKNGMTNRKIQYWVIPPDGEFVASMEEVLETYEKPYNPERPVICMDEQPVQLTRKSELQSRRRPSGLVESTMNTSVVEPHASSCSLNLWPVGVR